jgi:hypothetical protein
MQGAQSPPAASSAALVVASFALWVAVLLDAFARGAAPGGASWPPGVLACAGALAVAAAATLEAAAYAVPWRALGRPVSVRRVTVATFSLSALDALALPVVWRAHAEPTSAAWLAWAVGPRALGPPASGLDAALAGVGLVAAARVALLAAAHARIARVPWHRALAVLAAGWLLTRLVLWWTVDLVIGPVGGLAP